MASPAANLATTAALALAGCGGAFHPAGPDVPCQEDPAALLEDVSTVTTVVGTGTPASCTGAAFVAAVEGGGVVTFDCGPDPVTIGVPRTARIFNDRGPRVVIDGGGKVTLSGGGTTRILYMNTCDQALVWTTSHCNDQDHPRLTVQNIAFVDGNASGLAPEGAGGAIYARGGRFKAVNARFFRNVCDPTGPDVGGGAIRVFDQWHGLPAYVVGSTFGATGGDGNSCSNGGALSSIGVSWTIMNSTFVANSAIGSGANPARAGTPGGGSGGAVYGDGNSYTVALCGVTMSGNSAREGGGAVFFVSNDRTGHLWIGGSALLGNPSAGFETPGYPGIFYEGAGPPIVRGSVLTP